MPCLTYSRCSAYSRSLSFTFSFLGPDHSIVSFIWGKQTVPETLFWRKLFWKIVLGWLSPRMSKDSYLILMWTLFQNKLETWTFRRGGVVYLSASWRLGPKCGIIYFVTRPNFTIGIDCQIWDIGNSSHFKASKNEAKRVSYLFKDKQQKNQENPVFPTPYTVLILWFLCGLWGW